MSFDGRRPWMEDDLGWKMTLDGRRPWMEDDLGWKTTLDGRQRQPLMVDNLQWKTTFVLYRAFQKKRSNVCLFDISRTNERISTPFFSS